MSLTNPCYCAPRSREARGGKNKTKLQVKNTSKKYNKKYFNKSKSN
ncbi:MAG: hypothetical protein GF329_22290 [Candidatus Lokiarchaeota archaeon]|nr:hypothetical protein [Candidatus Lokiarchaeota archaeon]